MEKNPIENDQYHGQKGPLEVSNVPTPHPITKAFIDSAISQGIPFNPDVNGEKQEGVGPNQGTIKNGGRNNSARAFLDKAKNRKNLTIIKNAIVDKILLDKNNKAVAVKFKQNNSDKNEPRASRTRGPKFKTIKVAHVQKEDAFCKKCRQGPN